MPKVSIITTTYKHQEFIAHTIESILGQTYTNWELFIGDDSPDDETWEIIKTYMDKYPDKIKAWHHNPNKGIVDNMNFLISQVSENSEFLCFLEGDDMYTSNNLEKKLKVFNTDTSIGVVTSNTAFIDKAGNNKGIFHFFTPESNQYFGKKKWTLKELILGLQPPVRSFGNVMIKGTLKSSINNLQLGKYISEKMFIPYDYVSRLNIFPKTQVYQLKEKLFQYRFHNNNSSDPKNFEKGLNQMIYVYNIYKDILPNEVNFVTLLVTSKIHALKQEKIQSLTYLIKSLKYYPLKHIAYKISIILDIFSIKKKIEKLFIYFLKIND